MVGKPISDATRDRIRVGAAVRDDDMGHAPFPGHPARPRRQSFPRWRDRALTHHRNDPRAWSADDHFAGYPLVLQGRSGAAPDLLLRHAEQAQRTHGEFYGSALRCRIGRPGVSAAAAATIALASMP